MRRRGTGESRRRTDDDGHGSSILTASEALKQGRAILTESRATNASGPISAGGGAYGSQRFT